MTPKPLLIGWLEHVDFPEWGIERVKAKIDTGARTSALDVAHYHLTESPAGRVAHLRLALYREHPDQLSLVQAPVVRSVLVRNTSGKSEERLVIETSLRLGPVVKRIQVTIANRSGMLFPIILGRTALAGDFVVDVSKEYVW